MKRTILVTVAALALTGNACAERCEFNDKTRGVANMIEQGYSNAKVLQDGLTEEWKCDCEENEMKAYCNVGAPEFGSFLCCIPKGLSCKTKPSETDKLPKEKRLEKNEWKKCAKDHSFCQGQQLILPSSDLKKFPDGLDPVCGVEGTKAFEVAKKLGIPLRACSGTFFDRCECPAGEKKIMRDYMEFGGVAYLQPDCVPENSDDDAGTDNLEQEAKKELDQEKQEQSQEEEDDEEGETESKSSLRSNKKKKKTEKALFGNQDKLETDEKKKSEDAFFGNAKDKEEEFFKL